MTGLVHCCLRRYRMEVQADDLPHITKFALVPQRRTDGQLRSPNFRTRAELGEAEGSSLCVVVSFSSFSASFFPAEVSLVPEEMYGCRSIDCCFFGKVSVTRSNIGGAQSDLSRVGYRLIVSPKRLCALSITVSRGGPIV